MVSLDPPPPPPQSKQADAGAARTCSSRSENKNKMLHLFQPAWLMRWWYIVTLVPNIVAIVRWSAKRKDCKASGQANCCSVASNPPPTGDQFPGNDVPGHATRLVATQQPDRALHFTTSLACGLCDCQKLQAFNDKSCKLGEAHQSRSGVQVDDLAARWLQAGLSKKEGGGRGVGCTHPHTRGHPSGPARA